jgi:hypothetical protein
MRASGGGSNAPCAPCGFSFYMEHHAGPRCGCAELEARRLIFSACSVHDREAGNRGVLRNAMTGDLTPTAFGGSTADVNVMFCDGYVAARLHPADQPSSQPVPVDQTRCLRGT